MTERGKNVPTSAAVPTTTGMTEITAARPTTPLAILIERAIELIDCELDIVKMELEYPERFTPIATPTTTSPPTPLAKWNGTIAELLENAIPAQVAGKLSKPTGELMTYAEAVEFVETVFGLTITAPYDRRTKLLARKKNGTPFLDKMRLILMAEIEKMYK
jgi:hypothetical protein